jgi:hypothetical protein
VSADHDKHLHNALSVVRSIVRRTAQNSKTVESFAAHLESRIDAYARLIAFAGMTNDRSTDLSLLVAETLRNHGGDEDDNVSIDGPKCASKAKPPTASASPYTNSPPMRWSMALSATAAAWRFSGRQTARSPFAGMKPAFRRCAASTKTASASAFSNKHSPSTLAPKSTKPSPSARSPGRSRSRRRRLAARRE